MSVHPLLSREHEETCKVGSLISEPTLVHGQRVCQENEPWHACPW